jgi:hypothetical protein
MIGTHYGNMEETLPTYDELPQLVQCNVKGCDHVLLAEDTILPGSPVRVLICKACQERIAQLPEEIGLGFGVCLTCETISFLFDPRRRNIERSFASILRRDLDLSKITYYLQTCPACSDYYNEAEAIPHTSLIHHSRRSDDHDI